MISPIPENTLKIALEGLKKDVLSAGKTHPMYDLLERAKLAQTKQAPPTMELLNRGKSAARVANFVNPVALGFAAGGAGVGALKQEEPRDILARAIEGLRVGGDIGALKSGFNVVNAPALRRMPGRGASEPDYLKMQTLIEQALNFLRKT